MNKKVLIIEDDLDIANLVRLQITDIGYKADISLDGREGLEKFRQQSYELVILDIMLPGMNGLEICKAIRAMPSYVPILMLTAKSGEIDRVLGLELGADDYLTKPFSVMELAARVKAIFRRIENIQQNAHKQSEQIHKGDISIDLSSRTVMVREKEVLLTAREFDLLTFFAQHPGQVFTRTQLLDDVWGYGHDGYEHTVNSHINRLRAKIEINPAKPDYIITAWGVGYKFTAKNP
jgi:DNA-binding response OmpR family regulator